MPKDYLKAKVSMTLGQRSFHVGDHVRVKGNQWLTAKHLDFYGTITAIHAEHGGIGNSFVNFLSDSGKYETICLNEIRHIERAKEE